MLAMWTVYEHPTDYPDKYVARRWEVDAVGPVPTASIIISSELDALRDVLQHQLHLVKLDRNPQDDPKILETWL